jgi:hypothetical protein
MARQTPADLADEIRATRGLWLLDGARLQLSAGDAGVSIAIGGGGVWSDVALERLWAGRLSQAATGLRRSGYEIVSIRSKPFHARSPLRGLREIDAETRRLVALTRDGAILASFPRRMARRPGLPGGRGPISMAALERLTCGHGWTLQYITASRMGPATIIQAPAWSIGAWCCFLDDGDDRLIFFHVQLFSNRGIEPKADDFARLERTFRKHIAPLGYRAIALDGKPKPALRRVREAGRHASCGTPRTRALDRVLFGD